MLNKILVIDLNITGCAALSLPIKQMILIYHCGALVVNLQFQRRDDKLIHLSSASSFIDVSILRCGGRFWSVLPGTKLVLTAWLLLTKLRWQQKWTSCGITSLHLRWDHDARTRNVVIIDYQIVQTQELHCFGSSSLLHLACTLFSQPFDDASASIALVVLRSLPK